MPPIRPTTPMPKPHASSLNSIPTLKLQTIPTLKPLISSLKLLTISTLKPLISSLNSTILMPKPRISSRDSSKPTKNRAKPQKLNQSSINRRQKPLKSLPCSSKPTKKRAKLRKPRRIKPRKIKPKRQINPMPRQKMARRQKIPNRIQNRAKKPNPMISSKTPMKFWAKTKTAVRALESTISRRSNRSTNRVKTRA